MYTYTLTGDTGKVRLLIPDTDLANEMIFNDEEITALLALENSNVKRAAALALEVIAGNEALVFKAIRVLDIQTDGPRTAEALFKRAGLLRAQADAEDAATEGAAFDIAEPVVDMFTARQAILNGMLRGAL